MLIQGVLRVSLCYFCEAKSCWCQYFRLFHVCTAWLGKDGMLPKKQQDMADTAIGITKPFLRHPIVADHNMENL